MALGSGLLGRLKMGAEYSVQAVPDQLAAWARSGWRILLGFCLGRRARTPLPAWVGLSRFMWVALVVVIGSLLVLAWSADRFIEGAAACAGGLGMSPMLIGMTLVSVGTSAPEILVSLMAAMAGASQLAIGNAVGSNIANLGLVLGVTICVAPVVIRPWILRKELPILLAVTCGSAVVFFDLDLDRSDALLLVAGLCAVLYLLATERGRDGPFLEEVLEEEKEVIALPDLPLPKALATALGGLVLLLASSRALVWGATSIAQAFGISELVIGLTVIAVGTSLPELAASVASALKGHHDIALGNVLGSNIFNLLLVLLPPALMGTTVLEGEFIWRDFGSMFLLTMALLLFAYGFRREPVLRAPEGVLLLLGYFVYTLTLLFAQP